MNCASKCQWNWIAAANYWKTETRLSAHIQSTGLWVWTRCQQERAADPFRLEPLGWRRRRGCFGPLVSSTKSPWPSWWPRSGTPTPTSCGVLSPTTRRGWDLQLQTRQTKDESKEKYLTFLLPALCLRRLVNWHRTSFWTSWGVTAFWKESVSADRVSPTASHSRSSDRGVDL